MSFSSVLCQRLAITMGAICDGLSQGECRKSCKENVKCCFYPLLIGTQFGLTLLVLYFVTQIDKYGHCVFSDGQILLLNIPIIFISLITCGCGYRFCKKEERKRGNYKAMGELVEKKKEDIVKKSNKTTETEDIVEKSNKLDGVTIENATNAVFDINSVPIDNVSPFAIPLVRSVNLFILKYNHSKTIYTFSIILKWELQGLGQM